jgi:thiol-disulfide isomerase/thioredoxin
VLDWSNFDEFMSHREDKMVVVDFYAPWCHW